MRGRRTFVVAALALVMVAAACSPKHAPRSPLAQTGGTGPTTTAVARPSRFLALGDSYTSGGGAAPYDVSAVCVVSSQSWPFVLARLDPALHLIADKACGGAKIAQVLQPWPERGQAAQIPGQPDPTVGLVAFTIGGNDVNLAQAIGACATMDCSGVAASQSAKTYLANLTNTLVDQLYPALRRAYPKARLVHVGYPLLTSTKLGQTCPWLSADEQTAPNDIVSAVDRAIQQATVESGQVEYLDVRSAFEGHELCTAQPWAYDVTAGPPALHPNAAGYQALGQAIATGLGR
jgi:lysophospholipase L1-like esterase